MQYELKLRELEKQVLSRVAREMKEFRDREEMYKKERAKHK